MNVAKAFRNPLFLVGIFLVAGSFCCAVSTMGRGDMAGIIAPGMLIPGAVFMYLGWLHRD
jgi:hypothetical protein